MSIQLIKNDKEGVYLCIDTYGIFAESKWYKTEEKLAFALVTNTVKWDSEFVERDKDDK
jgi:hypothetical protein